LIDFYYCIAKWILPKSRYTKRLQLWKYPIVPDLEISLASLLQSCMKTNTYLSSKTQQTPEDGIHRGVLAKFENVENQKLYLKLLRTSLSLMNHKFVLEVVRSPGFGRALAKHFQMQSNRKGRDASGGSSDESDSPDNEYSGLIKNLKSLLQDAQRKYHPAIRGNVSEGELERALSIMHNSILYQKLHKKEGVSC